MLELLPRWNLHANKATFYDTDSVTMLELASKLHGTMNELISEYNKFTDGLQTKINEFIESDGQEKETFKTALRQEFQDFIDVINLKIKSQDNIINSTKEYLNNNLEKTIKQTIYALFERGVITLNAQYNSSEEELTFTILHPDGGENA